MTGDEILLAAIITWIIGPVMFNIFSRGIYKEDKNPKFPVSAFDFLGDVILLPVFNALAVNTGIIFVLFTPSIDYFLYSIVGAIILTSIFIIYRKNIAHHNDWSRPEKGKFNAGGWYHATYMLIQSYFMIYTLLNFYYAVVLWVPIIGFIGLFFQRVQEISEIKKKK